MAKKCETHDEAFIAARLMKQEPDATKPAAITVLTEKGETEHWAIKNADDLASIHGFVEGITLV